MCVAYMHMRSARAIYADAFSFEILFARLKKKKNRKNKQTETETRSPFLLNIHYSLPPCYPTQAELESAV